MKPAATCLALTLVWASVACHPGGPASGRVGGMPGVPEP